MAATIRITSHHTASDDGSTVDAGGTTLYFQQADTDASGGSVPTVRPTIGSTSTASTGGTLLQNTTYYYKMTATTAAGETVASAEVSQLTGNTTATNTITLNWIAVAGATGYKIYRSTTTGTEALLATLGSVVTYVDTGTATTSPTPPTTNSSGLTAYSYIKQLRYYVSVAPLHTVTNCKFYMTGMATAGVDIRGRFNLTYTDPVANAATALTGTTSMYNYTAAAPFSLDGTFVVGVDIAPKFIGGFLQMQLAVTNATVANNVVLGSIIGRYDES